MEKAKVKVSRFSTKTSGLINFDDIRHTRYKILYAFMYAIMIAISLVCIVPIIWVALSSFKEPEAMYAIPPTFFPESISFDKIVEVWQKVDVGKYFKNSCILILGCWGFGLLFNGLAGYVLSRVKPLGSGIIDTLIFWSMLLPGISMVPLFMTFVDMPLIHINLTGTFMPMFLMAMTHAFDIFLFRNFFNGIPMSYVEAARLDGCSDMGVFLRIILPLSKPIVSVVTITSVIASWSSFMWPYLVLGANEDLQPVAVLLYKLQEGSSVQLMDNEYMMVLMFSIIPVLIVYAFLSKHIMGGMNMSGLKG